MFRNIFRVLISLLGATVLTGLGLDVSAQPSASCRTVLVRDDQTLPAHVSDILSEAEIHGLFMANMTHIIEQARVLTRSYSAAQDLVQDVWIQVVKEKRQLFRRGTNFEGWIRRVLKNRYISEVRRLRLHVSLDDPDSGRAIAAFMPVAVESEDQWLTRMELSDCTKQLPPDLRGTLQTMLASQLQLQSAPVSENRSLAILKTRVALVRRFLRRCLEGEVTTPTVAVLSQETSPATEESPGVLRPPPLIFPILSEAPKPTGRRGSGRTRREGSPFTPDLVANFVSVYGADLLIHPQLSEEYSIEMLIPMELLPKAHLEIAEALNMASPFDRAVWLLRNVFQLSVRDISDGTHAEFGQVQQTATRMQRELGLPTLRHSPDGQVRGLGRELASGLDEDRTK